MLIEGVVADANVLLSAAIGKAALRVITDFDIAVHVTQFNAAEVAEYLPLMSAKYNLQIELVEMQWKLLPLNVHLAYDCQDTHISILSSFLQQHQSRRGGATELARRMGQDRGGG